MPCASGKASSHLVAKTQGCRGKNFGPAVEERFANQKASTPISRLNWGTPWIDLGPVVAYVKASARKESRTRTSGPRWKDLIRTLPTRQCTEGTFRQLCARRRIGRPRLTSKLSARLIAHGLKPLGHFVSSSLVELKNMTSRLRRARWDGACLLPRSSSSATPRRARCEAFCRFSRLIPERMRDL